MLTKRSFGLMASTAALMLAGVFALVMAGCSPEQQGPVDPVDSVDPASAELITGPITANRTLGIAGGTKAYKVDSRVEVNSPAILTVLPGTTIYFTGAGAGFRINTGAMLKMGEGGTASSPVILTGVGNGKGSWGGIYFMGSRQPM